MKYHVEFTKHAYKQLMKMDKYEARMIENWISKNIEGCSNPRIHGKPLVGNLEGLWRYRIGEYRVITRIEDDRLVVMALEISHRRDAYEGPIRLNEELFEYEALLRAQG